MRSARVCAAAAAALCLLCSRAAASEVRAEALRLEGNIRTLAAASFNYDNERLFAGDRTDGIAQATLRLIATGEPARGLSYEVHLVQAATLESFPGRGSGGGVLPGVGAPAGRLTVVDGAWAWAEADEGRAELYLDRANAKLALRGVDLTLGRQAVNFGASWFWNPLDVFLPVDPRALYRDYRAGVDALRLDVELGALAGITVAAVSGRRHEEEAPSWEASSLIGRAFATWRGADWVLQGGKVRGGYLAGGSLAGEVAGLGLRAEAARTWADPEAEAPAVDHWAAVASAGRSLGAGVGFEAEYFYNGAGEPDNLQVALLRLAEGTSLQMSRHLGGLVAWFDITPLVRARAAWMRSLFDSSDLFQAGLSISLSDEADLRLGALVPRGQRPEGLAPRSEFGTYPGLVYLELRRSF